MSPVAEGKRRLMEAAVRQAKAQGSVKGLGLRELAREAGLNHNTFYRHFADMESMFAEIIADFTAQLRRGLRAVREQVPVGTSPTRAVLSWSFDFADQHSDALIVAARELRGPPGPVRDAMRAVADLMAEDMTKELLALGHLPPLDPGLWRRLLRVHATNAFDLCLTYLEAPGRRRELLDSAEELFEVLVAGAVARGRRPRARTRPE